MQAQHGAIALNYANHLRFFFVHHHNSLAAKSCYFKVMASSFKRDSLTYLQCFVN